MSAGQPVAKRIVSVEEHFLLPDLLRCIPEAAAKERGYFSRDQPYAGFSCTAQLTDVGDHRLRVLDDAGVSHQVLSLDGPGADLLPPREGAAWAREANDALAALVAAHPNRFAGLAHLPLTDPDAAAEELGRCVSHLGFKGCLVRGSTNGRYLDHPDYDVSISGWGWHSDTASHILRLMVTGAFDRHPGLQVVIGHLGEGLQILFPRLNQQYHVAAGMEKLPSDVLRKHVHVTMGGFFVQPSFMAALDAFGADQIMFSVDYPFGDPRKACHFWNACPFHRRTWLKLRIRTPIGSSSSPSLGIAS